MGLIGTPAAAIWSALLLTLLPGLTSKGMGGEPAPVIESCDQKLNMAVPARARMMMNASNFLIKTRPLETPF